MSLNNFYLYILVLFVGLLQAFYFFKHHFSGVDELKHQVVVMEEDIRREKTRALVAIHDAELIRQQMAELLPDKLRDPKVDYQLRNIASVVQAQEALPFDDSEALMKRSKGHFLKREYPEAISGFKEVIDRFPDSKSGVEAHFLLAESYYQIQAIDSSIDTIETMVTLFPESELTGFALLRLSGVMFDRQLDDHAVQVLQTVRHNFSFNKDIVRQANKLLSKANP